jgi:metal-sulfur cluster biosynthetic enzyme
MKEVREEVIKVLKTVYDPEIWVNIYDLGLVYDIDINDNLDVYIKMTLTSPTCPVAESLVQKVESKLSYIDGVNHVETGSWVDVNEALHTGSVWSALYSAHRPVRQGKRHYHP